MEPWEGQWTSLFATVFRTLLSFAMVRPTNARSHSFQLFSKNEKKFSTLVPFTWVRPTSAPWPFLQLWRTKHTLAKLSFRALEILILEHFARLHTLRAKIGSFWVPFFYPIRFVSGRLAWHCWALNFAIIFGLPFWYFLITQSSKSRSSNYLNWLQNGFRNEAKISIWNKKENMKLS